MSNFAKIRVDLFDLARKSKQINGNTSIHQFQRLISDLPEQPDSEIVWSITGHCNSAQQNFITVSVQANIVATCQRCMGLFDLNIDSANEFILFDNQDAMHRYEQTSDEDTIEPLLANANADFDVLSLIEDELILSTPYVPKHDSCVSEMSEDSGITLNDGLAVQPSPFALLSKLKKS